jgi:hypothetical protein
MKRIIFSFILLGFAIFLNAQTVDSIKVEQAGELIKVHYKILNSNPSQVFRVTVYCSINGGLQSVIKSLSGDFGDNVMGGRSDYLVLWDVLKDVDEVKSVDFSVRAELVKDYSAIDKSNTRIVSKKRVHVFLVAGGPGPKFGAKIGYMESWGIAGMYVIGGEIDNFDFSTPVSNFAASLNLTKRIINANNFKLHLFSGVIVSKFLVENAGVIIGNESCAGIEWGVISSIHNFSFSFGISNFKDDRGEGLYISGDEFVGNAGFGWRF